MNDNGNKMMKEISLSKTYCIMNLLFGGGIFLFMFCIGAYSPYVIITAKDTQTAWSAIFIGIICLWVAYGIFTELVSFVRFYCLRVNLLDDKLILSTGGRECQIPIGKGTDVMWCMNGLLIIWRSENGDNMLLLKRSLLLHHWMELRSYFQSNANFISSKEDKKKILKLLRINVHNPFKYIKWPA
jgi:hypothetical protein